MFEWDDDKRAVNLAKHRLDFVDSLRLFDGRATATAPSSFPFEDRHLTTAKLDDGKFYTVIWTWRETWRRIISFRRARDGEVRAYRQIHG